MIQSEPRQRLGWRVSHIFLARDKELSRFRGKDQQRTINPISCVASGLESWGRVHEVWVCGRLGYTKCKRLVSVVLKRQSPRNLWN